MQIARQAVTIAATAAASAAITLAAGHGGQLWRVTHDTVRVPVTWTHVVRTCRDGNLYLQARHGKYSARFTEPARGCHPYGGVCFGCRYDGN